MGLRWKIALSLATVALIATFTVGLMGYRSTSSRLQDEVDRSITEATAQMVSQAVEGRVSMPTRGLLEVYSVRVLDGRGTPVASSFPTTAPVTAAAASLTGVPGAVDRATLDLGEASLRVHTIGLPNGALQVARPMSETDSVLSDLRQRMFLIVVLVSVTAALVGWLIAGTVAAPVRRLTRAAEHVGSSGRLDVEVPGTGTDEVGRLGSAFRDMLGALELSRAEQQRLVQDAGHELRTPLTSLKTNLSVLRRHPEMAPELRERVIDDLDTEITELTELVNELVAVASGELDDQPAERVELGALANEVAERVGRRRSREMVVDSAAAGSVDAPRAALDRAVTNLIDNACKFDQSGIPIEVRIDGGTLTVLDHGPGITPGDEERIFDRFHRSDSARSMPGSGLGLSIVREVVVRAGGTVSATNRDGGGTMIGFTLPLSPHSLPGQQPGGMSRPSPGESARLEVGALSSESSSRSLGDVSSRPFAQPPGESAGRLPDSVVE